MRKSTKIKYLFWHPRIGYLPKFLAFIGLVYSAVSPLAFVQAQTPESQKPALLALAETRSLFSSPIQPYNDNLFAVIQGSALVSQNSLLVLDQKSGQVYAGSQTKKTVYPSIVSDSQNVIEVKQGTIVTAYSSTPDQTDDSPFITAMGSTVRDGIVACNFLKFGTKVRLPEIYGDKVFVVEDRMAKKNSHKLDVWMETREQALQFGVKRLTLEILE